MAPVAPAQRVSPVSTGQENVGPPRLQAAVAQPLGHAPSSSPPPSQSLSLPSQVFSDPASG